jgi:MoxR-like ATPase
VGLSELSAYVTFGVSPRASINMVIAAQALALVRGRSYVLPEDLLTMAPDVLRHRLVLSYEALADDGPRSTSSTRCWARSRSPTSSCDPSAASPGERQWIQPTS